jgi:uncharacterized membrane protein (DUF485 family)
MSTFPAASQAQAQVQVQAREVHEQVNGFSVVAIALALFALVATVYFGLAIIAVFAVGAGHLALQQIKARKQRGVELAYTALGISYVLTLYIVVLTISVQLAHP